MKRLINCLVLLLLLLWAVPAQAAMSYVESSFMRQLKTNTTAADWQTALGLNNLTGGSLSATNITLTGTGAGALKLLDATANTNVFVSLSAPSAVGTNFVLELPSGPASGYLYGTWDGANKVVLTWNTNGASGGSGPTMYLGLTNVPYAWYDARSNVFSDFPATTVAVNNSSVKQWSDLSPNGRNLTNNSGQYLVYKTAQQNSLPGVTGPSATLRTVQSFGGLSGVHVFMVMQSDLSAGYGEWLGGPNYNFGSDWFSIQCGGGGDVYAGTDTGTKRATATIVATSTTLVLEAKLSGGLVSVRKNNGTWTAASTGGSQNTPATPMQLGNAANATSMKYFAIVVYNSVLSDTDAATVEANLNATWAVH